MKHLHHIIPRHAGGTDDPSNLVELTVEEHARAHYLLWNQHGRWQDKLAWKSLSGMIGKEDLISTLQSLRSIDTNRKLWSDPNYREIMRKSTSERNKRLWKEPTFRNSMSRVISERNKRLWSDPNFRETQLTNLRNIQPVGTLASQTEEARQNQKETFKRIGHQQGSKNSQFGKMWITNGSYSYKINKNDSIPEGYRKGRVITPK